MTEFRAPAVELARFRLRVAVAVVVVLVCLGLLAARFHFLQVQRHDYFLTRAEDNRIALLPVVLAGLVAALRAGNHHRGLVVLVQIDVKTRQLHAQSPGCRCRPQDAVAEFSW